MRTILSAMMLLALVAPARADEEPWIGVQLDKGAHGGLLVQNVYGKSPAAKAGVRAGDEIVGLDGSRFATPADFVASVRKLGAGKRIKLELREAKGRTRTVTVTLEKMPNLEDLERGALTGIVAPDFAAHVVAGDGLDKLSSLKGQVVVLDFFATWCGPCREAMPRLEALHEKYGARGLRVVGVSTEEAKIVAGARDRFGLKYTLVADEDRSISNRYIVSALPTAIVVGRDGKVALVAIADTDALIETATRLVENK